MNQYVHEFLQPLLFPMISISGFLTMQSLRPSLFLTNRLLFTGMTICPCSALPSYTSNLRDKWKFKKKKSSNFGLLACSCCSVQELFGLGSLSLESNSTLTVYKICIPRHLLSHSYLTFAILGCSPGLQTISICFHLSILSVFHSLSSFELDEFLKEEKKITVFILTLENQRLNCF